MYILVIIFLLCSFNIYILNLDLLNVYHFFFIIFFGEVHHFYQFFRLLLILSVFLSYRRRCRYRRRCMYMLRCWFRYMYGCASIYGKQAAT